MQSRLHLPKLDPPPKTILEHLIAHFPQIPAATWCERMARGLIFIDDGAILTVDSPYRHGITVVYSKEVPNEPPPDEHEIVLYQDNEILIADKPHGMVVTPSGDNVERSMLIRLQRRTGLTQLAPMHRLDRETAGLVLFTLQPQTRGSYHHLFSGGTIEREYLAVSRLDKAATETQWLVKNRMEEGEPWFRQRLTEHEAGEANAITGIELVESQNGFGLFRLRPESGKKHQLRVHMASIGFPIVGDLLYPELREKRAGDSPLQLLAHRLSFIDPLSGEPRRFTSERKLLWPME